MIKGAIIVVKLPLLIDKYDDALVPKRQSVKLSLDIKVYNRVIFSTAITKKEAP